MPKFEKHHLVAIIAIIAAHDLHTNHLLNRITKRFKKSNEDYAKMLRVQAEQMAYLVHLLNENDVPFDEFDAIALMYNTNEIE